MLGTAAGLMPDLSGGLVVEAAAFGATALSATLPGAGVCFVTPGFESSFHHALYTVYEDG